MSTDANEVVTLVVGKTAMTGAQKVRKGRHWSYTLTVERPAYTGPAGTEPPPFPVGASAVVEVSNDGKGWVQFGTLEAPLTDDLAVDPTGISGDRPYWFHRASITNIIGEGATAYVMAVLGA